MNDPQRNDPPAEPVAAAWRNRVLALGAGAVLLRLLLFLGRGDYVAFDEGFYLLLGRSLVTGDGFSLIGTPHVTLSPLFPLLAGAAGALLDSWLWGGRVVAALASGLLVLPAWAVFRRLAPPRTAFVAVSLVAVLPSLAPFVVPFWIGADLWVGAEPLLHLLLYAGVALWLAADERGGPWRWAAAGALLGLAFLARPEAVVVWGLLGLVTLGLAAAERSARRLSGALLMAVGFALVCTPYWVYIHDATGRWSLTGRGVAPAQAAAQRVRESGQGTGAAGTIERMLWADDRSYERYLYGLDPSGLRMQSAYWGVAPDTAAAPTGTEPGTGDTPGAAPPAREPPPDRAGQGDPTAASDDDRGQPSMAGLYIRSLGRILPLLLWPFVILGAAQPRSRTVLRRELPIAAALVGTSLAIAFLIAADPRTQLFLVPLLAFYAARGFSLVEDEVQRRAGAGALRAGFIELMLAAVAVVWLLGIDGRRLYLSLVLGSPHHVVAEQNRQVAEELETLVPGRAGPVMSWHPALAVFADRDWRPLPHADLPAIIRYAGASGADVIVLSAYYPPDLKVESLNTRYLVMSVPPGAVQRQPWNLRFEQADSIRAAGVIEPTP